MRRNVATLLVGLAASGCTNVRDDDADDATITISPEAGAAESGASADGEDTLGDSSEGSGGGGGTTTTGNTSMGTAFETLTTHATTMDPDDPTNTSSDTNETGASQVDILPENLIDDLEDGDAVIYELGGRIGLWYAYDDGSVGTSNPAAMTDFAATSGGPNGSSWSAIATGSGFTTWGAGIGFDINNSGGLLKHTFDASGFTGIAFQGRGNTSVKLKVQTEAIVPVAEGGTCNAGTSCNDAYFVTIELGPSWTQHVVPFASLAQGNWGQAAPWDPATVVGVQWEVAAGTAFEIAIDDVGLYE
ncbi:MAG: hypothetical protein IAG13_01585 [Deltaproteobacteria bacterium]|nr:hypothetical protein [Nannocystaceae bacterium]